ncbi:MAG: DegT/DnrJ/EryC1/StrS family aminotransferase [Desulfurococcaceae archaeon]
MRRVPIAKPVIEENEIRAVVEVLRSRMLAQGKEVEFFEQEFANYIGVKHAIAVANGTLALDTALKAIGIKPGDEVITTAFTFIATANAILYQGARPVFADIDPKTYNLDPNDVLEKITNKTKAIIVVHLYGQPADMKAFKEIAEDHKLILVEDCAQAHGAEFEGIKVGSLGHVGVFSFYPTKNMTTGEGGIITTNDDEVARKSRLIRDHGQARKYVHEELGYNYRMTNIAAAIGRAQLKKLDILNEKRIQNATYLTKNLANVRGIITPYVDSLVKHVYNQYVIRVENDFPLSRDELATRLEEKGVAVAVHYPLPVHQQPLYKRLGYPQHICPNAIIASRKVLSLPVHPLLTIEDLDYVVSIIKELIKG